jgi:hypothetical protein
MQNREVGEVGNPRHGFQDIEAGIGAIAIDRIDYKYEDANKDLNHENSPDKGSSKEQYSKLGRSRLNE